MGIDIQQSIGICSVFAALGGVLEVLATAVLAYPAARIQQGYEWTDKQLKGCLAINIILQVLASLSGNLFATWFGPISIGTLYGRSVMTSSQHQTCLVALISSFRCLLLCRNPLFR
jgi:hypothetical protein